MSHSQNLSTRNALCRLTLGISMVAFGTARLSRNPHCSKGRAMVLLGAMKAAEGTVKFCPIKALMKPNEGPNEDSQSSSSMMYAYANNMID